jgi:hypothetical protein
MKDPLHERKYKAGDFILEREIQEWRTLSIVLPNTGEELGTKG